MLNVLLVEINLKKNFALVLERSAVDNLGPAQFLDLLVSFVPQNSIVVFI